MTDSETSISENFLFSLRQVLGEATSSFSLHEPQFSGNEWAYVKECIDTGWVSSVGKYVDEFELKLAEFTGARHAVAVVNGTAALQIALQIAGVKVGDEVLVPALSFVATANAVSHCGAVPHFVDSSESTLGLDAEALAYYLEFVADRTVGGLRNKNTGRKIAAIVPMHTFGHPVDMGSLMDVAKHFSLPIVEDAAESLGSTYHGSHTGTFGCMGVLSFNGNKTITTGGGGAILTDDIELAKRAKHLTTTAKLPHRWDFVHDEIGFNYRMPNLNAALGCAQLEQLPGFLEEKRQLFQAYREAFSKVKGVSLLQESPGCKSNYWLQTLQLDKCHADHRDGILEATNKAGFMTRPVWRLMHHLSMYKQSPRAPLPVAEYLESCLVNIPSSAGLLSQVS